MAEWLIILTQRILAPLIVAFIIWLLGSTVWLVREVLRQRNDMDQFRTQVELEIAKINKNCDRHQGWSEGMQTSLARMDRNIVRLCAKNGVQFEEPKS